MKKKFIGLIIFFLIISLFLLWNFIDDDYTDTFCTGVSSDISKLLNIERNTMINSPNAINIKTGDINAQAGNITLNCSTNISNKKYFIGKIILPLSISIISITFIFQFIFLRRLKN